MDAIQAEKETAMCRYRRLQQISSLLRCLEVAVAIIFFYWTSARLPGAACLSADFLRRVAAFLLCPHFIFLLGNSIVLLLLAKSGQLSSSSSSLAASSAASSGGSSSCDIFKEFLVRSLSPAATVGGGGAAAAGGCIRGQGSVRRDPSVPEEQVGEDGAAAKCADATQAPAVDD